MIYLGLAHMMGLDLHQHDQMAGPKISKKLLHLNKQRVQILHRRQSMDNLSKCFGSTYFNKESGTIFVQVKVQGRAFTEYSQRESRNLPV